LVLIPIKVSQDPFFETQSHREHRVQKTVLQVFLSVKAIYFGPGRCVLVLERSLAGAIIQVLGNFKFIPKINSHHPSTITSTSTSTNSISFGQDHS